MQELFLKATVSHTCTGVCAQRPEITPNVQLYTSKEYLRVNVAKSCDIKASIGMPILRRSHPGTTDQETLAIVEVMSNSGLDFAKIMSIFCSSLSQYGLQSEDITSFNRLQLFSPEVNHL